MKNNLRRLMGERGITSIDDLISQLPEGNKLSRSSLYRIMRGYEPSLRVAMILAAFLEKDVREVFELESVKVS